MSQASVFSAIETYARAVGSTLPPNWDAPFAQFDLADDDQAIEFIRTQLAWDRADHITSRPQPGQFPLLVHDAQRGWMVARQWISENELALIGDAVPLVWDEAQSYFALHIPDPLHASGPAQGNPPRAIGVFANAIKRRGRVLVVAGVATVFANLLTLATSLYAMQLYDRVIPLASFETLFVLTVGVLFALVLDFTLRSLRAILIETEAQNIDKEVSEFFFARAQAIRLDTRPKGIGTMAAQIQGQEQIRQVMSSSSLFVFADLPFAILFIFVIAGIGGSVALVPVISLPIAVALAFLLARLIRKGAERAQVTGNQKNGMLVEMLDASETIKSNLGGWHMIGRWNALIRQIHHYEDPVKRISAVSTSLFSGLQQASYVAVMGYGAYLAAMGQITTGGLLACSIIVGRINGPLISQLPNLIVQWGYARSSLKALDTLLQYPVERSSAQNGLRPADLNGAMALKQARFAYDQGAPAVQIEELRIMPGERVAIVGGIGAGKSTLLRLLSGLYTAQSGAVTLNNYAIDQLSEDVVRRHIGYLSQSTRLIRGSLRDSLLMGLPHIADEKLIETARATGLETLFGDQKPGLDGIIEEGGTGLSGGQRALVGINRLIHQSPSVWILDEPSASLDVASEKLALDAIEDARKSDDIVIVATHKIALLERFTRVVVMANGQIVGDQSVAEFMRKVKERKGAAQATPMAPGIVTTKLGKNPFPKGQARKGAPE